MALLAAAIASRPASPARVAIAPPRLAQQQGGVAFLSGPVAPGDPAGAVVAVAFDGTGSPTAVSALTAHVAAAARLAGDLYLFSSEGATQLRERLADPPDEPEAPADAAGTSEAGATARPARVASFHVERFLDEPFGERVFAAASDGRRALVAARTPEGLRVTRFDGIRSRAAVPGDASVASPVDGAAIVPGAGEFLLALLRAREVAVFAVPAGEPPEGETETWRPLGTAELPGRGVAIEATRGADGEPLFAVLVESGAGDERWDAPGELSLVWFAFAAGRLTGPAVALAAAGGPPLQLLACLPPLAHFRAAARDGADDAADAARTASALLGAPGRPRVVALGDGASDAGNAAAPADPELPPLFLEAWSSSHPTFQTVLLLHGLLFVFVGMFGRRASRVPAGAANDARRGADAEVKAKGNAEGADATPFLARLASPPRRVIAFLLDVSFAAMFALVILHLVRGAPGFAYELWILLEGVQATAPAMPNPIGAVIFADWAALFVVVLTAWFTLHEAARGATPGKRLLGLRVVMLDGRQPGVGAAATRGILLAIDLLPYPLPLVGFASTLVTRRRQRVGDLIAGTVVIDERRSGFVRGAAQQKESRPQSR